MVVTSKTQQTHPLNLLAYMNKAQYLSKILVCLFWAVSISSSSNVPKARKLHGELFL